MSKKIYVLDTNVLLHNPRSLFHFSRAHVAVPAFVLEELDTFKSEGSERGRNAREVMRSLDALRASGSLKDGVAHQEGDGGVIQVAFLPSDCTESLPFEARTQDNGILLVALCLQQQGHQVTVISKDLNVRVKADVLGLTAEDYVRKDLSVDTFYHGWRRVAVPAVELKKDVPPALYDILESESVMINEFMLVESQHNPHNYRIFRYRGGKKFSPVAMPDFKWPITARNAQQRMALDLLLDDDIKLVSLFGPAGTGKTFLTLLAGLHSVLVKDEYQKLLIARPIVPLGKDVGYLPGTLQEKLHSWMLPMYDNMELIIHNAKMASHEHGVHEQQYVHEQGNQYKGKNRKERRQHEQQDRMRLSPLDKLIERGKISLEAITYMRGRSIPYQFILIDEVQNLTAHEVKTLISRVGEGSKIILAGDPYQIDSPYLDFNSNGLLVTNEKMKGSSLFGAVHLEMSERSQLSQLAIDVL